MADYILISGQTVSGLVVSAGTDIEIGSGAVSIDTLVKDGGSETVFSGGITSASTIRAGGYELISSGGTAIDPGVKDGGYLVLGSGGTTSSATVSGGGTMIVSAGGVAIDTVSAGAAVLSVTNLVTSGETVSGVTVGSSSLLDVGSGGLALSTTVIGGGVEIVSSGGTASGTIVSSGATLDILAGGSAAGTIVDSGGTFIVLSGGTATSFVVSSGGAASVKLVVSSGVVSSGLVADPVTSIYVLAGGVASGTIVTSGGTEVISPLGQEIGTVVSAGGYDVISGSSLDTVVSGIAVIQGGETSGLTIAGSGNVETENAVLGFNVLSNTTITGQGTLTVSDGNDVTGSVVFEGGGAFIISSTAMPFATLSNFTSTNTLDLASVPFSSSGTLSFADNSLVISEGGRSYVLELAGAFRHDIFLLSADPTGGTLVGVMDPPPCFVAGTLIATPGGAVPVERLSVGDVVLTEGGGVEPVIWTGQRRVDCGRHAEPQRIWPVCIRADAFGPSRPSRDLLLSPDHAIFAEGVLIPVKHLINGRSITQLAAAVVTYVHVELPRHAVILAEGLPVESYLDTGDRAGFTSTEGPRMLHPVFGSERTDVALVMEALGCAPFRVTGPEVEQTCAMLARRAELQGETGPDAGPGQDRRPIPITTGRPSGRESAGS
jgi:autotransporter passenger strand-loop-strand repeat protein